MSNNGPMIVEFPPELKGMWEAVQALVDAVGEKGREHARLLGGSVDYSRVEKIYGDLSAKIESEAHGATLRNLVIDAERVMIRGKMYRRVGEYSAKFFGKAGPTPLVTRPLYRETGVRSGPTCDPVALRIGAIEGHWLPGTAKAMAHLVQGLTSREAEEQAREMGRVVYSRSSMERIAHAVGDVMVRNYADIEDGLINTIPIPEKATGISVSIDRAALPMEEPRPRPKGRPAKNAPKNPISRVFHMAFCGAITLHDYQGEALFTLRYAWSPDADVETIADRLARDALFLRLRSGALKLSVLSDGADDVKNILDKYINEEHQGVEVTKLIDVWHVLEKLGEAVRVLTSDTADRKSILARWKKALLTRAGAHEPILRELRYSGKEWVRVGDEKPVHAAITYLENQGDRMNYAQARREGLPIGSGNVEATCKTIIELRMRRAGSRWKNETAYEVMLLRSAAMSHLWDPAVTMALETLRTSVRPVRKIAAAA